MATQTYAKKDVTFSFANGSTRKVTVGNFDPTYMTDQKIAEFKSAILEFNNSDVTLAATAYFSNPDENTGTVYPVTGITAGNVVTTEKTVIYAKDSAALKRALNEGGDSNGDE